MARQDLPAGYGPCRSFGKHFIILGEDSENQ